MGKNRKASLIIERPIKTYWGLNHASYVLLEKSKGNDEPLENGIIPGNYYTTMASLIFSAFTLEAYFNHLGSEKINFWKEIEFVSVENKLRIFEREFSLDINYGKRPYQTFRDLFKFRNALAHGKSGILVKEQIISSNTEVRKERPKTKWENYCTEKNAQRAREDVRQIIQELHNKSNSEGNPFIGEITTSSISLI